MKKKTCPSLGLLETSPLQFPWPIYPAPFEVLFVPSEDHRNLWQKSCLTVSNQHETEQCRMHLEISSVSSCSPQFYHRRQRGLCGDRYLWKIFKSCIANQQDATHSFVLGS